MTPPAPAKFARNLRIDREKSMALLHFAWCRFIEDRCTQTAGALAYTSIFALVPLTAAILGILAAFPVFAGWRDRRHAAQARFHAVDFFDAARDEARELRGLAVAAVVEDEDFAHLSWSFPSRGRG